ncbi:SDR family NAD(P)-dependent oxidoreductase [Candidatus Dojkabacteria bacterium]|uniref:SDR family NAD(P)-dependent oxidoreductase n=1 Tax=Candidatus Dojkabacteria bacterium TaxID=2099670 RepID=A0A955RIE7_9BACT|nr:SDR family NAD(P)-dependent oxidoreductase [Candidatus Dojkabacteria bacterium]
MKILITGGNSGLGFEITNLLVQAGHEVIILGKDKKKLDLAKKQIDSDKLSTIECDLRDPVDIDTKLSRIEHLDILINNAGIISYKKLEEETDENIKDIVNTNLLGTIFVTKKLLPVFEKQNSGIIMNISSTSGLITGGHSEETIYVASKFGITGFTETLKKEMKEQKLNIRVLGFYPGGMNTDLFAKAGLDKDTTKFMDPKEIAKIVVFILERPEEINMDHVVINRNKAF